MKQLLQLSLLLLILAACSNKPESNAETHADSAAGTGHHEAPGNPESSSEKPDFSAFQKFFLDDSSMDNWPEETLEPLILNGDEIFSEKGIDALLRVTFTPIEEEYFGWIPVEKLKRLQPDGPETKNPRTAFQFFGHKQITTDNYLLLSIFAYKLRNSNPEEFHAHPFFLATFHPDGKPIDQYIWWTIENDVYQVWDDVDVDGEVLLKGKKNDPNLPELDEVYERVEVSPEGKFVVLESNWP